MTMGIFSLTYTSIFYTFDYSVFLKFFFGINDTLFSIHYYSYIGDKHYMFSSGRVCMFYNKEYILDYQPAVENYLNYLSYNYYEIYQHYALHMTIHPREPFNPADYQTIHEPKYLWFMHEKTRYNYYW